MAALLNFIFRSPPSIYLMVVSAVHITSYAMTGLKEVKGSHMKYSKFANHSISSANSDKEKEKVAGVTISSKAGMLLIYTPAFVASAASFGFFFSPFAGLRPVLVSSALAIHFLKRILEVSFLHRYSGGVSLSDSITICLSYFFAAANSVYSQKLVVGESEPQVDLMSLGVGLFLLGIVGNFYHHLLLSQLRKEDKKKKGESTTNYKVPRGGLFDLVVCPHYLLEIIDWFGIACISQTLYPFCFAIGSTFYLMGRSYATRKWYQSKFEDFPKGIKALVPFVF